MHINDSFDGRIEHLKWPERGIALGDPSHREVLRWGLLFLALGLAGLTLLVLLGIAPAGALAVAGVLGASGVVYDVCHRTNPLSPLVIGVCRGLVYVTASLTTFGSLGAGVWLGALGLVGHVVGPNRSPFDPTLPRRTSHVVPFALLASPLAFVLLHYWSTLALLSAGVLGLWIVHCVRTLDADSAASAEQDIGGLLPERGAGAYHY